MAHGKREFRTPAALGNWYIGIWIGSGFTISLRATWKDAAWENATVGDFDGDGRDDLAARIGGQWWVARSTGVSFSTSLWGTWQNAAWKAVGASQASAPAASAVASPLTPAPTPSLAIFAGEDERHAQFWSSVTDDDELASALLAV